MKGVKKMFEDTKIQYLAERKFLIQVYLVTFRRIYYIRCLNTKNLIFTFCLSVANSCILFHSGPIHFNPLKNRK